MKPKHFTAINRPIDPSYPTNRAIALILIGAALIASLAQLLMGEVWLASLIWGGKVGVSIFLSWVVCRELDPDRDYAAFVAAGLAVVVVAMTGELPALALVFWLILILRILNRTTGLSATLFDAISILGLTGWLAWQGNWELGFLTAVAFGLDAFLPAGRRQQLIWAGGAMVIAGIGLLRIDTGVTLYANAFLIAIVIAFAFIPVLLTCRTVQTVGDQTQVCLTPQRVQGAQVWALLAGVVIAGIQGIDGLQAVYPLWAGVLGATLYWVIVRLRQ